MWAVVGLGNPGKRYSGTRHNIGFVFIKGLAREWKIKLRKRIFLSKVAEVERKEKRILLATPLTFMNKSGLAVKQILEGRRIQPENTIVVYDDLDIPLGEIRIRKKGGAGTHKGMISIVEEMQTMVFPRLRIGIGPLPDDKDAIEYVLSPFKNSEKLLLEESLRKARQALDMILSGKAEEAMNIYNQRGEYQQS